MNHHTLTKVTFSFETLSFKLLLLDENKEDPNLGVTENNLTFKQGRQLLRQYVIELFHLNTSFLLFSRYLKEIGYVDTIIDIRSTAVKKLLGIKSETNFNGNNNNNNNTSLNGDIKPMNESKR